MTKLEILPGVCGMSTTVTAESEDGADVTVNVESTCKHVRELMEQMGTELDAYEICFGKPGTGPLYETASEAIPHMACPTVAGIIKCIEAECKLALPKDVSFHFVTD